jgi:predicted nucleic acid-binding protein
MKYDVLDASVAVASLRPHEPSHAAAVARLTPLVRGVDSIVVPTIFRVEVGSALARAGFAPRDADRFIDGFLANATVVTLGPVRTRSAQRVASTARLRAVDAIYAWLAAREGIPLVTLDREVLQRASSVCEVTLP